MVGIVKSLVGLSAISWLAVFRCVSMAAVAPDAAITAAAAIADDDFDEERPWRAPSEQYSNAAGLPGWRWPSYRDQATKYWSQRIAGHPWINTEFGLGAAPTPASWTGRPKTYHKREAEPATTVDNDYRNNNNNNIVILPTATSTAVPHGVEWVAFEDAHIPPPPPPVGQYCNAPAYIPTTFATATRSYTDGAEEFRTAE
ncbi:hypothetical protein B0H63DRAFT_535465 [Podospora didyma]|uniref:Secreted protein n=1 Tax=Podospora didyma TaxID=330526 RepID=A0AAE0N1K8_9PEZI|nr:hypothetical protein B0H63DRAFT_535465 [Podospora didyma]